MTKEALECLITILLCICVILFGVGVPALLFYLLINWILAIISTAGLATGIIIVLFIIVLLK